MNKNKKGFGCLVVVISLLAGIFVAFSKLNNDRTSGKLKSKIIKKIKIK